MKSPGICFFCQKLFLRFILVVVSSYCWFISWLSLSWPLGAFPGFAKMSEAAVNVSAHVS